MEYGKVKSAPKQITVQGERLNRLKRETLGTIAAAVGATLGPHGQPVLIERQEFGLPPMVTKDGVTVFRSLGFDDPTAHCIMEATRDCAVRTANEAGDGTTTATILAAELASRIEDYCSKNPHESAQKVVRELEATFRDFIAPSIAKWSRAIDVEADHELLRSVARISANGDSDLADAVMDCFDQTGDEGNVTIVEASGPSHYEVKKIEGYSIDSGYDESCGKFYPAFINDPGTQRCTMEKPLFVLYHGNLTEIQTVAHLMEQVGDAWQDPEVKGRHNVVICAIGFSDQVLAHLAAGFSYPATINVFPLVVPHSPQSNGQMEFLLDVQAITGAKVLDPINAPLETALLTDLGPGVEAFECSRFRSTIIGYADATLIELRVDELNRQLEHPESELDAILTRTRKAKIAGGIAQLIVFGASNGELKEKRDRAEDAVCAVRGAIKHGCLPGGAWALTRLLVELGGGGVNNQILVPALSAPFKRLLANAGIVDKEEIKAIETGLSGWDGGPPIVYDFMNHKHVDAFEAGILDSTPAVLEAIRNSFSIASLIGTLGGCVVFKRDHQLERDEARNAAQFARDSNVNEANERA